MEPQIWQGMITALGMVVSAGMALWAASYTAGKAIESIERKATADRNVGYNLEIFKYRIQTYPKLWSVLQPFSFHPPANMHVTNMDTIGELHRQLVQWYYEHGGLVMTEGSFDAYMNLLKEVARVTDTQSQEINQDDLRTISALGSELRTETIKDLNDKSMPTTVRRQAVSSHHSGSRRDEPGPK